MHNDIVADEGLKARFQKRVEQSEGCWRWTGYVAKHGYGVLSIKKKPIRAHRIAWVIAFGAIPDGKLVCHRCDNPLCVRPDHLFLGSVADNNADMREKGRLKSGAYHLERDTCCNGHPKSQFQRTWRGKAYCIECKRARGRATHHRRRDRLAALGDERPRRRNAIED